MKIKISLIIISSLCSIMVTTHAQSITVMTYNVENLFDTKHDSLKNDYEFLPNSEHHWTYKRFSHKIHQVMQVITGVGQWNPPMLVGLCEIENDYVLQAMTKHRPYNQLGYDYIHFESPDNRGIDVALLYQAKMFTPLISRPISVILPNGSNGRDILYVCGTLNDGTILHLLQVHFPSRRQGVAASETNRIAAAGIVRNTIDSIQNLDSNASIILMGDFNDNPFDYAPSVVLGALPYNTESCYESNKLYNLSWNGYNSFNIECGTYFHNGNWDMLDQIIVSGSLLNGVSPLCFYPKAEIFKNDWITNHNSSHNENIPNRTYLGPHYNGGVSDHFPLYIKSK